MPKLTMVVLLTAALVATAGRARGQEPRLFEWGRDPARGELVNLTAGAGPCAPIDPTRPTVVVVHGLNPLGPVAHCTVAEGYAESIGRRYGAGVNVLGWDWNGATMDRLMPRANDDRAEQQGLVLASSLMARGVDPSRLHFIGQSSGCLVVASASRVLVHVTGRFIGRITLLDPAWTHHARLFEKLQVQGTSPIVEHYWAPGPSGFGREARRANVDDRAVSGPNGLVGLVRPFHTDHLHAVRWHIRNVTP